MSRRCPKCRKSKLIELQDADPDIQEWVCPTCAYYESNSQAFSLYPWMFADLGTEILTQIRRDLVIKGLTESEGQSWLEQEPTFTKGIVTPLDDRRKVTPLHDRRRGTRAVLEKA